MMTNLPLLGMPLIMSLIGSPPPGAASPGCCDGCRDALALQGCDCSGRWPGAGGEVARGWCWWSAAAAAMRSCSA